MILDFQILSSIHIPHLKPWEKASVLGQKKEYQKFLGRLALTDELKTHYTLKFIEFDFLEKFNLKKSKYKLSSEQREINSKFALIWFNFIEECDQLKFNNFPGLLSIRFIDEKSKEDLDNYIKRWWGEMEFVLSLREAFIKLIEQEQLLTTLDSDRLALELYQRIDNKPVSNPLWKDLELKLLKSNSFKKALNKYQKRIIVEGEIKSNPNFQYKYYNIKQKPNFKFGYQKEKKV